MTNPVPSFEELKLILGQPPVNTNPTPEVIRDDIVKERFRDACAKAAADSKESGCTVYINARLVVEDGLPYVESFVVSDWFGGETVATYHNGKKRD